jgi:Ca2+-binding RTX toxin-like protein
MATYTTNVFTLDPNEIDFSVPTTVEGGATPANSKVIGNSLNNVLTGDGTNNWLEGGLGNDTLIGGLGFDKFFGGEGFDTVSYAYSGEGVTVDLTPQTGPALAAETYPEAFDGVEAVIGSAHADTIKGRNDVGESLNGGAGIDNIQGGGGDDTIIGGAGADILNGGAGNDTLSYATAGTGVNVTLNSADELVNGFGTDEGDQKGDNINGFENLIGSSQADTLNGNTAANRIDGGDGNDSLVGKGGNDTLVGGLGADIMQGLADNDLYYVDDALDTVSERGSEGYDHVITTVTFDLAARGNGEVELFQAAAGNAAINLYGNYHTNRILGNDANNVIDGRGGADTMQGGAGDDTYTVENPGDLVIEDSAFGGTDLVNTTISYALTANVENLTGTGTAAISLSGNNLNNVIIGNSGNNVIIGGGGADMMMGGGGNDTYYIDDLGDRIVDNSGVDTVIVTNPRFWRR